MTRSLAFALFGMLFLQANARGQALPQEKRETFRRAVEDYQMFVVPHCTPLVVEAYRKARAKRDLLFVQSLRGTELEADYRQAVAHRAELDRQTIYECMVPPPHLGQKKSEPTFAEIWASHTKLGDQQFAVLVRLRDRLIGRPQR